MIKKLVKHGNSLALIFDKPVLELLKINRDTPLEITTNGESFTVRPVRESIPVEERDKALNWVNEKYGTALRNLAGGAE
ncbi:AbrB/MazE/SpoVT family DNA-binding domain-containing protein [bacterium]|nr:AbrB/MazE/SpoVT family DNA-binding domain-containing protein [bacterium]